MKTEIKLLKQSIECKEMLSIINDKKLAESNKRIEELEVKVETLKEMNKRLIDMMNEINLDM